MDMSLFTSFQGRISRQPFWLGLLALMVIQWVVMLLLGLVLGGGMMAGMDPADPEAAAGAAMAATAPILIVSLVFLWPSLAIYTKRWHDRGKSGWWSLILFVPVIGFLWMLVECGFLRGTEGENQYGFDPLGG